MFDYFIIKIPCHHIHGAIEPPVQYRLVFQQLTWDVNATQMTVLRSLLIYRERDIYALKII